VEARAGDGTDAELIVRDGGASDRRAIVDLLASSGSAAGDPEPWSNDAAAVVLYDPASDDICGVAAIRALDEGTFALFAWAVRGVTNPSAATARIVQAAADRARRAGGERLVATVDGDRTARAALAAAGFEVVQEAPAHRGGMMTLYLEL
jgi:hypothetical protein